MFNLYYLMPSLPALRLDTEPTISIELFYEIIDTATVLTEEQKFRLESFQLTNPPTSFEGMGKLEEHFWSWDLSLRNELVRLRATALGIDPEKYVRIETDRQLVKKEDALRIFQEDNPLEVELIIDEIRWNVLANIPSLEIFSFDALLTYSMHLQILIKRFGFKDLEKGRLRYNKEYERILAGAQQVLSENI